MLKPSSTESTRGTREALRKNLLERRMQFMAGPDAAAAGAALARHLMSVLRELEPELIGAYAPHRSEFNALAWLQADPELSKRPIALPFAQRTPPRMHYRHWDGGVMSVVDECGIASSDGAAAAPDVVLVPCVGFTADGFRLGYGGGFFDRWLAEHPDVTAIGVAWSLAEVTTAALQPLPHDLPLSLIVTENGVA